MHIDLYKFGLLGGKCVASVGFEKKKPASKSALYIATTEIAAVFTGVRAGVLPQKSSAIRQRDFLPDGLAIFEDPTIAHSGFAFWVVGRWDT